jgi:hypothetical protein
MTKKEHEQIDNNIIMKANFPIQENWKLGMQES